MIQWSNIKRFDTHQSRTEDIHMCAYFQQCLPKLQEYQPKLLERLALLVNIDSGTSQAHGVNAIMAHLERWMSEIGFDVMLYPDEQYGNNLLACRKGKGGARILLVGHVDTVYPAGAAATQPFAIQDGLAKGPGVIDMKSGVLMGLYTLRVLLESGFENYGELYVVFNNDEEVGSPSSAPLLRDVARQVDVALVLEPSREVEIVTKARKGADKYVLEVTGVPAHSGAEPFRGRSAVIELAHKMIAIHNLNTLYPGVTFNVTRISSSEPLNVVPDFARCHISVRAYDEHLLNMAASALERIASSCFVPDTRTHLLRTRGRIPYETTEGVSRLVEMAQAEWEAAGFRLIAERKGGVSDANTLMHVGVPTLDSLGPLGGGMHDLNREYLRVDSIPVRGALLAGLITHICLSESTGV
jgi:glutamate carboxypeptidase